MIEYLKISNLALLKEAQLEFSKGFTVVTGETGAGKSVLLGALSMLAGNRCGREIVGGASDSCKVEAVLNFSDTSKIDAYLEENGVPACDDGVLVIARTVNREKSGRAFVNGALVPLSTLAGLGVYWVDFHGPGEPQKLFSLHNQLAMLDSFAGNSKLRESYLNLLQKRSAILREIEKIRAVKSLTPDEVEFLKLQIAAIDAVNPTNDGIAELEEKFKLAEMASDIVEKSSSISDIIDGDGGVLESLAAANKLAGELSEAGRRIDELRARLESASFELADISDEFKSLARGADLDESQIQEVREKMSSWLSLARKYGASAELVRAARESMKEKIETQSDVKSTLQKLSNAEISLLAEMSPIASEIMKTRLKAAKKLSASAMKLLERLGFKNARFEISVTPAPNPGAECGSGCEFKFSANPGQPLLGLAKIASSGELARVMLALKTTLADADSTPLLVFDEVDANVGGEIGAEVGKELAHLAERHQVFCVTHLPQVAACAGSHFLVEKTQTKTSTSVSITSIGSNRESRISELARMLGDRGSSSALAHAERLLG